MKFSKQSYEILGTPKSLEEAWQFVEKAARNCYRTEPKGEDAEYWCRKLLLRNMNDLEVNHLSPLEFGTIYLDNVPERVMAHYRYSPFNRIVLTNDGYKITTNLRYIIEHRLEGDLEYAGSPTKYHVKFLSFMLNTCIHVYKDLTRHRSLSFAIESTRYCNYAKEKFGSELTFVLPACISDNFTWSELGINDEGYWIAGKPCPAEVKGYLNTLSTIEQAYFEAIEKFKWTPQEAAEILPQSLFAHVMMGGYPDNLNHMFRLRADGCSGKPHPLVSDILIPLKLEYEANYTIQE